MYNLVKKLDKYIGVKTASAHCDVPCGIYDPYGVQISALTVVRMVDLIEEHAKSANQSATFMNRMARLVATKETHAEAVKHEVRVIWGDFIKEKHLETHPNIHVIVHEIMQLASACRQHVDRETGLKLVEKVNQFSEIFWSIKGEQTIRAKAPYAPNLELVYRKV